MTVTRKGKLDSILAKLENAQKRGLIEAGMLIAQRAADIAPIDTGRLKRSITQGMPERRAQGVMTIDVGTNVEYAPYQEFGTSKMKAQPYLIPAMQKSKEEAAQLIVTNIIAALKQ